MLERVAPREGDHPVFFVPDRHPAIVRWATSTPKDLLDWVAFAWRRNRMQRAGRIKIRTILRMGRAAGSVPGFYDYEFKRPEVAFRIDVDYQRGGIAKTTLFFLPTRSAVRPGYARASLNNVAPRRVLEKCRFALVDRGRNSADAPGGEIVHTPSERRANVRDGQERHGSRSHVDPGLRIRPATRTDIPAIVRVSTSSLPEGGESGFGTPRSEQVFADRAKLAAAWRDPNLVGPEEVLVAEIDGRVVGCVSVEDRGEVIELVNIDVAREHQGRGIGTCIVEFVEDRARAEGRRAVTLGTSRSAAGVAWKSLSWWQKRGYLITGEEENAWTRSIGSGVREIRMRKNLE